ncbi:unnamed protein product [Brassica rapa]|uniref:BnaAnng14410D protein n=2 Tax=Brassica TaxID=3705 RepID=A0A078J124_BRANA|nr:unnamed protein product [Brassica rapa]CDY56775.1 BnaAnng14410D [Brassica napus]VDC62794.1 unnamed protein product [Brassica rapa]
MGMELDVQRFLQQQFDFQHFPISYLRFAAHRVANQYGLATPVQDSAAVDGNENIILVTNTAATQSEYQHMKVSIKSRPSKVYLSVTCP